MSFRFASLVVLSFALTACANKGGGTVDMGTAPTDMGTNMDMNTTTDTGPVLMCDGSSENEDTVALCSDGCDNDGNGFTDCNDFGCCDVLTGCGATTACGRPDDGGTVNACDGGGTIENTTLSCSDGCDNDTDGFADCNDFDCCAVTTCGSDTACGRRDGGSTPVTCEGPAVHENTVETCTDGCSNDGNAFVDCNDRNCCGIEGVVCAGTTYCATHTTPSVECMGAVEAEDTLEKCSDSCSNDTDPFVDCNDFDCCDVEGIACGTDTMCGMSASDAGT